MDGPYWIYLLYVVQPRDIPPVHLLATYPLIALWSVKRCRPKSICINSNDTRCWECCPGTWQSSCNSILGELAKMSLLHKAISRNNIICKWSSLWCKFEKFSVLTQIRQKIPSDRQWSEHSQKINVMLWTTNLCPSNMVPTLRLVRINAFWKNKSYYSNQGM